MIYTGFQEDDQSRKSVQTERAQGWRVELVVYIIIRHKRWLFSSQISMDLNAI